MNEKSNSTNGEFSLIKGKYASYDELKYTDGVYFAEDEGIIIVNGVRYGLGKGVGGVIGVQKFLKTKAELNSLEPPATEGQVYYVEEDKLLYTKTADGWNEGESPKPNMIYNHRLPDEEGRSNVIYRWDGETMVEISESLVIGETEGTAYDGASGKKNSDDIEELKRNYSALNERLLKFEEWYEGNR